MILNKKQTMIVAIAVLMVSVVALSADKANANPTQIIQTVQTATATTSGAFMTPGSATSTVVYDSYANTGYGGLNFKADSATLATQITGSSTLSVFRLELEYSQDGIDWYRNYLASTTNFASGNPILWTNASTTINGVATLNAKQLITVPTPVRYVRVVSSVTGANGTVWAQFIPIRELK